jgi:hypothetical protein
MTAPFRFGRILLILRLRLFMGFLVAVSLIAVIPKSARTNKSQVDPTFSEALLFPWKRPLALTGRGRSRGASSQPNMPRAQVSI